MNDTTRWDMNKKEEMKSNNSTGRGVFSVMSDPRYLDLRCQFVWIQTKGTRIYDEHTLNKVNTLETERIHILVLSSWTYVNNIVNLLNYGTLTCTSHFPGTILIQIKN